MSDVAPGQAANTAATIPAAIVDGALGMWLNKRSMSHLEVPIRHRLSAQQGGWRMHFGEAGRITAHTSNGPIAIDVDESDYLISSGDDFYVAIRRGDGRDPGKGDPHPPAAASGTTPSEGY